MRKIDFSAIATSVPQNKTAARVMSKGFHYEPTMPPIDPRYVSTDLPLPIAKKTPNSPTAKATAAELIGKTFGRFTVKGLAVGKSKPARWVVRCSCGRYEHRRAKTLRGDPTTLMCSHCDKVRHYAKVYREQGGKSVETFFAKSLGKKDAEA